MGFIVLLCIVFIKAYRLYNNLFARKSSQGKDLQLKFPHPSLEWSRLNIKPLAFQRISVWTNRYIDCPQDRQF